MSWDWLRCITAVGRLRMIQAGRSCRTASYAVDPFVPDSSSAMMTSESWLGAGSRDSLAAFELAQAVSVSAHAVTIGNFIHKKLAYIPRSRRGAMSPRSKIVTAAILFSSGGAAIKFCGFGAWQLAACRAALAMLTILVLLPESRRGWSWRTVVVGFAYAATTLLYVQANKHTTAASAIFLQSTSPLFILLLAPVLLGEHATRRDIGQMAVMGVGLGLFLLGHDQPSATAPNPVLGNVLAAICAVTWAFTVMGYRWLAARGQSVAAAAVSGNLTAGTIALVMAPPLVAGRLVDWAVVVFLGVCQLGIPYLFLARAVPRVRALEVGLFLLIEPVLNPIWAWLVHGEKPGPATLVGGMVILGATAIRTVFDTRYRSVLTAQQID